VEFVVKATLDEEGNVILKDDDKTRFMEGRDGDHLMTPFQCELCHFRNLYNRNPLPNFQQDVLAMDFMRRVNLDAFWKTARSTVKTNCYQIERCLRTQLKFGIPHILPPVGPFALQDECGMGAAMAVLDRSLDKGKHAEQVQWATFRKMRSAITNYHQASSGGMQDRVGAYEKSKTWITSTPTFGFFFSRFMVGLHKRVGEIVIRDEPLSIEHMLAIERLLEDKWRRSIESHPRSPSVLLKIAHQAMWYLGGFCSALRGEEMPMMELAGTRASTKFLTQPLGSLPPHFDLVVAGRTKGNQLSGAKFKIPVCAVTSYSKLKPGIWMVRLCRLLGEQGRTRGYLFGSSDEDVPKLQDFHEVFFETLEELQQARPDLIGPDVEVRELYGILRTLRRSATAHATNRRIPSDIVNSVNRWRTEKNSEVPVLDMQGTYARLDFLKEIILKYSSGF